MELHGGSTPVTLSDGEELLRQPPQRGLKTKALFTFGLFEHEAHWTSLFTIVINNLYNLFLTPPWIVNAQLSFCYVVKNSNNSM
jgi:hypothetical protein